MNESEKFGFLLKKIRIRQGLRQKTVAERVGVTNTQISKIEKGLKNPTIETISKVVKALDISFNQFLADYLKEYGNI